MSPASNPRTILHIITRPADPIAASVIGHQRLAGECQLEIVDASQTEPDYRRLLEQIFAADSVQVW